MCVGADVQQQPPKTRNVAGVHIAEQHCRGLRQLAGGFSERGADYKMLYAFSDFVHPQTDAAVSEHAIDEHDFDQPLLAGLFLDKLVIDRNAVQTVSRLNRCHKG